MSEKVSESITRRPGKAPTAIVITDIIGILRESRSVPEAAEKLKCSRALVYKVLKANGKNPSDVMELKQFRVNKRCGCGIHYSDHPKCEACFAPICAVHKDTILITRRGHKICQDCKEYWKTKDKVLQRKTTFAEFTQTMSKK